MTTCTSCGFEGIGGGVLCPLCGATHPDPSEDATVAMSTVVNESLRAMGIPSTRPRAGDIYAGRFHVESLLGEGGMGSVYKVRDEKENQPRALKIIHSSISNQRSGAERFQREVAILSKLRHPAIPTVYEWGQQGGDLYFIAEFLEGEDLRRNIKRVGPWPIDQARMLIAQIADALELAHEHGVVHRDVKPHNIMIGSAGEVHLVDFGIARGVGIEMNTITASGVIIGTPEYMSPEQLDSNRVDGRSDLYSLGVVLFQMLTGKLPFDGSTPFEIAMKHKTEAAPSARPLRSEIPAWLDRVMLRCLEKDPARRFHRAAELAAELRKSRETSHPRTRRLPNGDVTIEDETEMTDWSLVLESAKEKKDWSFGMALLFNGRHYKLEETVCDPSRPRPWRYSFLYWPQEEIFRKLVDYQADSAEQPKSGFSSKIKGWLGKG